PEAGRSRDPPAGGRGAPRLRAGRAPRGHGRAAAGRPRHAGAAGRARRPRPGAVLHRGAGPVPVRTRSAPAARAAHPGELRGARAGRRPAAGGRLMAATVATPRGGKGTAETTIRVGVIGTGGIGTDHATKLARTIAGSTVSAVTDIDRARCEQVAAD